MSLYRGWDGYLRIDRLATETGYSPHCFPTLCLAKFVIAEEQTSTTRWKWRGRVANTLPPTPTGRSCQDATTFGKSLLCVN